MKIDTYEDGVPWPVWNALIVDGCVCDTPLPSAPEHLL